MSVHNGAQFLRPAIESVLSQSFDDFEFIVVDDGSTDQSLSILRSYSDPRLRVLPLTVNGGLVAALNLAIEHVQGEFVARMDADDECEHERLQVQVAAMVSNPEVVLLGSQYSCIDGMGRCFAGPNLPTDNATLQRELLTFNAFCHPSVIMRLAALKVVGGYRALGGRFAQDYDLWLRLAEHGQVMNLPQTLLRYRVHGEQVTVRKAEEQMRAAELYRVLAGQRRNGAAEDLRAACSQVERMAGRIRAECAADLMRRAKLLDQQGEPAQARELRRRALRQAPLSPAVLHFLRSRFNWYLTRVGLIR